ncbi:unnamed protein product [Closterium sp. NIES-64]|nr:unnamed protein product [Closterium sp. NIES-64]
MTAASVAPYSNAPRYSSSTLSRSSIKRIMLAIRRSFCLLRRDAAWSDSCAMHPMMDIGQPFNVKHVAHVTFDRYRGFLGLPEEFLKHVEGVPPSASLSVFGVRPESMQCSLDRHGNAVPTILIKLQERLYELHGLSAEGIFRISGKMEHDERVREQMSAGTVPADMDVHSIAALIKNWFQELPYGLLDSVSPSRLANTPNTTEAAVALAAKLPATERGLLDWALNLMADVCAHGEENRMSARNMAVVFAPNMTQVSDPATALQHVVRVMDWIRVLVDHRVAERSAKEGEGAEKGGGGTEGEEAEKQQEEEKDIEKEEEKKMEKAVEEKEEASVPLKPTSSTVSSRTVESRAVATAGAAEGEVAQEVVMRVQMERAGGVAAAGAAGAEKGAVVAVNLAGEGGGLGGEEGEQREETEAVAAAAAVAATSLKRPTDTWVDGARMEGEEDEHVHKRTRSNGSAGGGQ